jgi:Skp family chaperone for outer membrane proteins
MGYLGVSLRPHKPEVVFVKTGDVMSRFKLGIKARETFQKETSAWEEESKQLEGKMRELAKTAKPTDEKAMEQARQLRSRMQTLRDKGAQRDQELMAPVIAEINSGIKKFAQKNGYKLVLGTLQGGVVLHGEDAVDVTEALITEMNK